LKIVLDANVLVRAAGSPGGPAARLLREILDRPNCTLQTSPYILDEVEDVLSRPRLSSRWGLSSEAIAEYRLQLHRVSEVIEPAVGPPIVGRDAEDDAVFYTAVAGQADFLCTLDGHFRTPDVLAAAQRRGIEILSDKDLLVRLGTAEA